MTKSHSHLKESSIVSEQVYDGHFLKIQCDKVTLPDGKTAIREYIKHPGAVVRAVPSKIA